MKKGYCYSPEPRDDAFCSGLNFNISKVSYSLDNAIKRLDTQITIVICLSFIAKTFEEMNVKRRIRYSLNHTNSKVMRKQSRGSYHTNTTCARGHFREERQSTMASHARNLNQSRANNGNKTLFTNE